MKAIKNSIVLGIAALAVLQASHVTAQSEPAFERIELRAENRPLGSLSRAAEQSRSKPVNPGPPREIPNYRGQGGPTIDFDPNVPDPILQNVVGSSAAVAGVGFPGTDNATNGTLLGFRVAPPDTDGEIGGASGQYFVQMINLLTTVFDNNGNVLTGPFASNAIWANIGGNCQSNNQGDPIVLYDEQADRWLFSQFAFPDNLNSFSQCVAISQTDDPRSGYNRYEFSFNNIGLNDYPKHGIVSDSITLMANIFRQRGPFFRYSGTFLAVLDKAAMYSGQTATMRGFNIGTGEFGFVSGDLDGPGSAPALFATAMSTSNAFDIWQIDPDWSGSSASINQVASVPITPYDGTLCGASRGACIPQPDNGPALESLSDRLMHRLQIRDFGSFRTMVTAHTVDVGSGRAGIRWYELRETGGAWTLYQEGTYAPADGQYRWMPSVAMNGNGDIGMGFLLGGPNTYMSISATGQTAAASGSGVMDATEISCVMGSGVQEGTARSGDYSSTSLDPSDDTTFWHTNEYVDVGGSFVWDTWVCPFTIGSGGNIPPTAAIGTPVDCTFLDCNFDGSGSSDSGGGSIISYAWDFGDGNSSAAQNPSHSFTLEGTYDVSLTVTDNDGATDTDVQSVTVDDGVNNAPSALITLINCTGLSCNYDGSGSSDSDGSITSYDWDFGDGNNGNGVNTNHTYVADGTYDVTLTITDNDGDTDTSAPERITVSAPAGAVSVSVASILANTVNRGGGFKSPTATVTIQDDQGNPANSYLVTGDFTGDVSDPGLTGTTSNGSATLTSSETKKGRLKFEFCVTDVSGTLPYEPLDNVMTCASN